MEARIRFYAELNDFLVPSRRQRPIKYQFDTPPAVKDTIESLGVPHPEVDLILVNGRSVGFDYLLTNSDYVSVYPRFNSLDVKTFSQVCPPPLNEHRFVLDVHLGQLARYLRMFGFDALYHEKFLDPELATISSEQQRILLTRDRGLLKRSIIIYGYCLRTTQPRQQLIEVLQRFNLTSAIKAFRRCLRCNGYLEPVAKETITHRLQPETAHWYDEYRQCQQCGQIYWKGSHFQRMEQFISGVVNELQQKGIFDEAR